MSLRGIEDLYNVGIDYRISSRSKLFSSRTNENTLRRYIKVKKKLLSYTIRGEKLLKVNRLS